MLRNYPVLSYYWPFSLSNWFRTLDCKQHYQVVFCLIQHVIGKQLSFYASILLFNGRLLPLYALFGNTLFIQQFLTFVLHLNPEHGRPRQ